MKYHLKGICRANLIRKYKVKLEVKNLVKNNGEKIMYITSITPETNAIKLDQTT